MSDTVIGVATQCVQKKHTMRPNKQYCANVCLKINVKLGGMNSFLKAQDIPFISDRPTILMGADVTHPAPGKDTNLFVILSNCRDSNLLLLGLIGASNNNSRPSIASLCASMDAKASRYAASIRVQAAREEIIVDLANMAKELLKTFYQTCGRKPERILFYRDGVSEGQFSTVLNSEIKAVKGKN